MKVGVLIEFTSNTDIDAKFAELKEMGVDSCQLPAGMLGSSNTSR